MDGKTMIMRTKKETVCAVVVTYNRKQLLIECLDSLMKQTHPLDAIYVIDNASTDGTPEILKEKGYIKEILISTNEPLENESIVDMCYGGNQDKKIKIHYVRMHENTGGAGGFHYGIKRAYEKGFDWLWCMDDDTIPHPDSLLSLVQSRFFKSPDVGFLCSHVVWVDGQVHMMNVPQVASLVKVKTEIVPFNFYLPKEMAIPISGCSFVSVLIRREAITMVGLPLKEFFIWCDDIEYTARINKQFKGYYIPTSIVTHKTRINLGVDIVTDSADRLPYHFYNVRNKVYLAKHNEISRTVFVIWRSIAQALKRHDNKLLALSVTLKGIIAGIFFKPQVEYPNNERIGGFQRRG